MRGRYVDAPPRDVVFTAVLAAPETPHGVTPRGVSTLGPALRIGPAGVMRVLGGGTTKPASLIPPSCLPRELVTSFTSTATVPVGTVMPGP